MRADFRASILVILVVTCTALAGLTAAQECPPETAAEELRCPGAWDRRTCTCLDNPRPPGPGRIPLPPAPSESGAGADAFTFHFRSEHPSTIHVEFYSATRNAAWPGGNSVFYLYPGHTETYRLQCIRGEMICYGAWVPGTPTFWGVGYSVRQGTPFHCTDCCYVCGSGQSFILSLRPF
jgi:hypothetical protein